MQTPIILKNGTLGPIGHIAHQRISSYKWKVWKSMIYQHASKSSLPPIENGTILYVKISILCWYLSKLAQWLWHKRSQNLVKFYTLYLSLSSSLGKIGELHLNKLEIPLLRDVFSAMVLERKVFFTFISA